MIVTCYVMTRQRREKLETIEPKYRADATRTRGGNGLGLALVNAVADRRNAGKSLEVVEQGLRVTVNLPK